VTTLAVASGAVSNAAKATEKWWDDVKRRRAAKKVCWPAYERCSGNPYNCPNPLFGKKKPCLDCLNECVADDGIWPSYRCPDPGK
jgi:hypothetical protein